MFSVVKIILKRKKYLRIAVLTSASLLLLTYFLTLANIVDKNLIAYADMNGYYFTFFSVLMGIGVSVLSGVYVAMALFRRDISKKNEIKSKAFGSIGVGAGLVATGCPTCGAPILGLIGFPLGLISLPLEGLELKFLSVVILIASLSLLIKNIKESLSCEVIKNDK